MKTRTWVLLLGAVFLALAALTALQFLSVSPAASATVYADGAPVRTVDLSVDATYRIESAAARKTPTRPSSACQTG